MKKNLFNIRRILVGLALSGIMITTSIPVFAKTKKQTSIPVVNIQPVVEHLGFDSSGSLFLVKFDTEIPAKFELLIRDANGDVLYSEEYESQKFAKYFKLVNEGGDTDMKLYFTIRLLPKGETVTFDVSSTLQTVSDIVITKL